MAKSKALEKSIEARQQNREKAKQEFLEVYSQKANNIHLTCKAIGIERVTFYRWLKDDDAFREKITALEEGDIDSAETA